MTKIENMKKSKLYVYTCIFVLLVVLIADVLPDDVDFGRSRVKTKSKIQRKLEEILQGMIDFISGLINHKDATPNPAKMPVVDPTDEPDYNVSEIIENVTQPQETSSEQTVEPKTVAQQQIVYTSDGQIAEERTIKNIKLYVRNTMTYEFNHWPQNIDEIKETHTGDCSDYSTLIKSMCEEVGIKGITKAHGWVQNEKGETVKHDWLEYNGKIIDGAGDFPEYDRVGAGYW